MVLHLLEAHTLDCLELLCKYPFSLPLILALLSRSSDHSFSNIFISAGSRGLDRDTVVGLVGEDVVEAVEDILHAAHNAHGL